MSPGIGYFTTRESTTISIDMVNWKPSDPEVRCTQVYGTVETVISLGSAFDFATTYTVDVNSTKLAFKGDQGRISPAIGPPPSTQAFNSAPGRRRAALFAGE